LLSPMRVSSVQQTSGTHAVADRSDSRSLLELLQFQAQRLQQMSEELNAAKTALDERKLIERAKLLLMKHRSLSEEQAHRLLRQMAMNQSRRLAEIARSVLEMADVWG
jgi:AmiR/NasT family two-component response regulator